MFAYVLDMAPRGCPRRRCSGVLVALMTLATTLACQAQPATPNGGAVRPTPVEEVFNGCPGQGTGPDPQLNLLKNRVDEGVWQPSSVAAFLQLGWPRGVAGKRMSSWAPGDHAQVDANNGSPVVVEGYLLEARLQEAESTNCDKGDAADRDVHGWLVAEPTDERATRSVIVEFTPRIRARHPTWTVEALDAVVRQKTRVRISGWTMLDPDHAEEVGKSRGTLWEIHPVMKIETAQADGGWKEL
jgi:hypothetical protein